MLAYYALYLEKVGQGPPEGIIVMDPASGDAMMWDHLSSAWTYDPELAVRFLDNGRNFDRYEPIDRATAEQITPGITSGEPLPDEETIRWVYHVKGIPPEGNELDGTEPIT